MRLTLNAIVAVLLVAAASAAPAEEGLSVSAKVDKTAVDAGSPITLTLTITGDLSGAAVPAPTFPDSFEVAARTQATNVSLRAGAMERSTSLVYVLIPSRPGTFQLGPFAIEQKGRKMETQPIDITVRKSPLPPTLKPDQSGRYTI